MNPVDSFLYAVQSNQSLLFNAVPDIQLGNPNDIGSKPFQPSGTGILGAAPAGTADRSLADTAKAQKEQDNEFNAGIQSLINSGITYLVFGLLFVGLVYAFVSQK